ncbi:MAG: glycosyl hydrolase family 17 protein [Chitinophagales bacterium]|jgi:exo-beta-1,3-glucanase (GH17 family)|nr:glycosyl hydrolase family 17 protein [Chitinophagales bacterium]
MSYRKDHYYPAQSLLDHSLAPDWNALEHLDEQALHLLFMDILSKKVHGFCFSMYEDGQQPGDIIPKSQVQRRMSILSQYSNWVRSFSCIEGNENVPIVAKEYGMNTLVGAWLGSDLEKNELEINALIDLAHNGFVDIAAVGNEVLYRNDLTLEQLLGYLRKVKEALPDIPVGYVDAYYEFTRHPELVEFSDIVLTNCYPFWEGTPFDYSLAHMNAMYHQTIGAAKGRKVIITETGWPSQGQSLKGAEPNRLNSLRYFIYTHLWAQKNGIETFYFSSFDESWKTGPEGDVGAHWGIWDAKGALKYGNNYLV